MHRLVCSSFHLHTAMNTKTVFEKINGPNEDRSMFTSFAVHNSFHFIYEYDFDYVYVCWYVCSFYSFTTFNQSIRTYGLWLLHNIHFTNYLTEHRSKPI